MKMAEALAQRKDLGVRISQLTQRMSGSLSHYEGDELTEQPLELLDEIIDAYGQLNDLVVRINRTNLIPIEGQTMTLMEMSVTRDTARAQSKFYRSLADTARRSTSRGYRDKDEAKIVLDVDPKGLDENADRLAKTARNLDLLIQQLDWQVDLVE